MTGRNGLNRLREAMTDCEVFSNSVWHVNCVPLLLLESADRDPLKRT